MANLVDFFDGLTPAQADVIASMITLCSALIVTIVAPLAFHFMTRKGMKAFRECAEELKSVADSTRLQVETIRNSITQISSIAEKIEEVDVLLASLQESLATTQNTLLDARAPDVSVKEDEPIQAQDNKEKVKTTWREIRDLAEQVAAHREIPGARRAKYARIDRRSYTALFDALEEDNNLPGNSRLWKEALSISHAATRGSSPITADTVKRITDLKEFLQVAVDDQRYWAERARRDISKPTPRTQPKPPTGNGLSGSGEEEPPTTSDDDPKPN